MSKITKEFRTAALRKGFVVNNSNTTPMSEQLALATFVELANLGFKISLEDVRKLSLKTAEETLKSAREVIGSDRDMTPVYVNYPKQVQEMSTLTLLVEQILHYWSYGAFLPSYPKEVRPGLSLEDILDSPRALKVTTIKNAVGETIKDIVLNPIAMPDNERSFVEQALKISVPSLKVVKEIVANAQNKENAQVLVEGIQSTGFKSFTKTDLALAVIETAKDLDGLARFILTLYSTPSNEKYTNNYNLVRNNLSDKNYRSVRMESMPNSVRRAIVTRIGELSKDYKADSLVSRQNIWRKIMRSVHPYSIKADAASTRALSIIHSNEEYETLNSKVEKALENWEVSTVVDLLSVHQPGNLMRRIVSLLRLTTNEFDVAALSQAIRDTGARSSLATLISTYNGVLSANDTRARVVRVAGRNNSMVERKDVVKVSETAINDVLEALEDAIVVKLSKVAGPENVVGIQSDAPMPIVRRDLSLTDREMSRGERFPIKVNGQTVRAFGHWVNNQSSAGYMDVGLVFLDKNFDKLGVLTWDSWNLHRDFGTYSGDKLVGVGDSAAEYFDIDMNKVKERWSNIAYVAFTVQSYSGFKINSVDFVAGAMLRSAPNSGEAFDPRTVLTTFKPTTESTQAVPYVIDIEKEEFIWIDSSNGSTRSGVSSTRDNTVESIVYDEVSRPRMTVGQLASLWAKAHNAPTSNDEADVKELLSFL